MKIQSKNHRHYSARWGHDKDEDITKEFFSTVQNKLLYEISIHTAAEIIETRSDIEKTHMGLTT